MLSSEEIFGPVLVVIKADTLDDALAVVNENKYGNGTAIFTQSGATARKFEREVQVGQVGINVPIPVPIAYYTFGGWKASGFGDLNQHGTAGLKFYTKTKTITLKQRMVNCRLRLPLALLAISPTRVFRRSALEVFMMENPH